MQDKWLAYQSFQQSQDVLEAINKLLIRLKLSINHAHLQAVTDIEEAKGQVISFLGQLEGMVQSSEAERPILGADLRLRQLAHSLSAERQSVGGDPELRITPLLEALKRFSPGDYPQLIEDLSRLRRVVERHIQEDALQVLGEL